MKKVLDAVHRIFTKQFFGKHDMNKKTAAIIIIALILLLVIFLVMWTNVGKAPQGVAKPTTVPTTIPQNTSKPGKPTPKPTAGPTVAPTKSPYLYGNQYLSNESITTLKNLFMQNKTEDLFLNNQVGTPITADTKGTYVLGADESEFLDTIFKKPEISEVSVVKLVDIDNDGQDEIASYKYAGRDDHLMSFSIMKKDDTGKFLFCEFPGNMGQFEKLSTSAFVKIAGKNYFVTATENISKGILKNLNIYAANSGTIVERAIIWQTGIKVWTDGVNARFVHASGYVPPAVKP